MFVRPQAVSQVVTNEATRTRNYNTHFLIHDEHLLLES